MANSLLCIDPPTHQLARPAVLVFAMATDSVRWFGNGVNSIFRSARSVRDTFAHYWIFRGCPLVAAQMTDPDGAACALRNPGPGTPKRFFEASWLSLHILTVARTKIIPTRSIKLDIAP
jgi:hypothetical protein